MASRPAHRMTLTENFLSSNKNEELRDLILHFIVETNGVGR